MKKRSLKAIAYLAVIVIVIVWIFPIFWMIMTSFKTRIETFSIPPIWFFKPTFSNYRDLFFASNIRSYFYNSIIVSLSSTAIAIFTGGLAAYSLSRLKVWRRENIAFWMLSVRMMPPVAAIIPLFLLLNSLNLLDSQISLILVYTSFNIGFATWVLRGFFNDIPVEVEESAMLDGLSRFGTFFRIVLPLSATAVFSTGILCLVFAWNEFLYALILTGRASKTMPVVTAGFITDSGINWGMLTAAGTIIALPIIIIAIFVQRYIVRGLTFGAVKQ
jgi:multiple sugar transport system permease protein